MASPQQPRWPVCAERAMHVLALCPCSLSLLAEEALRGQPGQRRHGAPGYAAFRIPRLPGYGVYGARDLRDAGLVRQVRQERSAARDGCRGPGEIAPYEAAAPSVLHEGDAIPVSGDVAGVERKNRTRSGAPDESISGGLCLSVTSHRFCIAP
jgi:hypothetical protein